MRRHPLEIIPAEICGECNGTGADYDANCRAIACSACGGSGLIELPASPPPADKTQEEGK